MANPYTSAMQQSYAWGRWPAPPRPAPGPPAPPAQLPTMTLDLSGQGLGQFSSYINPQPLYSGQQLGVAYNQAMGDAQRNAYSAGAPKGAGQGVSGSSPAARAMARIAQANALAGGAQNAIGQRMGMRQENAAQVLQGEQARAADLAAQINAAQQAKDAKRQANASGSSAFLSMQSQRAKLLQDLLGGDLQDREFWAGLGTQQQQGRVGDILGQLRNQLDFRNTNQGFSSAANQSVLSAMLNQFGGQGGLAMQGINDRSWWGDFNNNYLNSMLGMFNGGGIFG